MSDFPTTLRVIAAYKAGEDLAERLATAVSVQQAMSEALLKAADEIERLRGDAEVARMRLVAAADEAATMRLTKEEREAVTGMACYFDTRGNLQMQAWGSLLRILLERLK